MEKELVRELERLTERFISEGRRLRELDDCEGALRKFELASKAITLINLVKMAKRILEEGAE